MLLNVFQPLGAPASLAGEAKKIQTHWKVHLAYQPPTKKIKSKYLFKYFPPTFQIIFCFTKEKTLRSSCLFASGIIDDCVIVL